ncbi:MAG: glutaconyl-CoA decarboxylase subunit alpha [Lachnospiraceae bacterium]|nr:glutaconyl-CoA decarboxylase subunit alpha [Lachnospiraceae bacterium]MBQ2023233.1 glutaconyl-CoA decarboxylase subunit alpha [Lachnospiraceae bacterium]MBQ2106434.1 glutaconyl-CoA decarboxylase subunit alpha [Lachnospiraceae bacterium]MBQ2401499.1 glutaconyl-CoA decarboxylase subunit alpha [Lachnospiraceae bacterium]MBQ2426145.1 glutaconyl-CoA decarboxylase subunit alpha [Lachnospiraceae bacterium]
MGFYSMPKYFQEMPTIGKPLVAPKQENADALKEIEKDIHAKIEEILAKGITTEEKLNERGQLSAMQRINALVDAGTWCPLNSLFNPEDNKMGSANIINGLGRVNGKWVYIVASDNKKMAGTWEPGQAENLIRCSDAAKMMNIPLVYLLNCAGVDFPYQDKVYPNRRGGGTPFFRNAELNQLGIPVIVGIYGTNPAGGGYHSISPTILIAHSQANMAVGGAGILSGMNPKGYIDQEAADQIVAAQIENSKNKVPAPGSVPVHYDETGFFREVYADDYGVIDGIKKYISYLPAYNLEFFRVDEQKAPLYPAEDLYSIIPLNGKQPYDVYEVIARLFDGSQLYEYKKGYGPEMVTGLAKVNGLLVGVIANVQGILFNYPEYKNSPATTGGKLYRQGLVKMNEFVTLCGRDRIPLIWLQDTTGIDVGDDAEKAELLGLGQSLIYSIESNGLPSLQVTLRKASAAAHYVLGGPQGNNTNAYSIGTAACEYYVMPGETAANAMYSRKLVKASKDGADMTPIIDQMNKMIQLYTDKSRPAYCAKMGMVDEVVDMTELRPYIQAFTEAVYQNPKSICPMHQMVTPRACREFITYEKK